MKSSAPAPPTDRTVLELDQADLPGPEPDTGFDLMDLPLRENLPPDQVRNAARWLMAAARETDPALMRRVLERLSLTYPISTVIGICGVVIHGMGQTLIRQETTIQTVIQMAQTAPDDPAPPGVSA